MKSLRAQAGFLETSIKGSIEEDKPIGRSKRKIQFWCSHLGQAGVWSSRRE